MKELKLEEMEGIDFSDEILPQLAKKGISIKYNNCSISFPNIEEFRKTFIKTDTSCWCCGKALYHWKDIDILFCLGGQILKESCPQDSETCNHNGNCKEAKRPGTVQSNL